MAMVKLKLKKPQHLGEGRIGRTGQVFEFEEKKAAYITGMGKAELTTEKVSELPTPYKSSAKERASNEANEAAAGLAKALKEALQAKEEAPKKSKAKKAEVAEEDFPTDEDDAE